MNSCEEAIRAHGPMVYRLAMAYMRSVSDAEDVFQDVFLKYMQHADRLQSDEHRKAWLIRVTINQCRSIQRQWLRKRQATQAAALAIPFEASEETAVDEALAQLSAKYRAVIHLHYYEGYTTDEIARMLSQRPSAIRTQLTRARRMLGELLKGEKWNV